MYESEFLPLFENFPIVKKCFKGVLSIDQIPSKLEVNSFAILNNKPQGHPGEHWFGIYMNHSCLELFDSLVAPESVVKKFRKLHPIVETNLKPLMPRTSKMCGQFVTYFIINRILNPQEDLVDIIAEFFTSNTKTNERFVKDFLLKIG